MGGRANPSSDWITLLVYGLSRGFCVGTYLGTDFRRGSPQNAVEKSDVF